MDLSHWGKRNMDDEDYERQGCCPCGLASLLDCDGLLLGWSLHLPRVSNFLRSKLSCRQPCAQARETARA